MTLRNYIGEKDKENQDPKERRRKAYEFFVKKGYSKEQSLGIVGNLMQESYPELRTTVLGFDGTGSYGLAQWLGPRKKQLKEKRKKDYHTLQGQLEFIDWELNNTEKKANRELKKTNSEEEAALAFSKYYERPSKKYAENERRVEYAKKLRAELGEPYQQDRKKTRLEQEERRQALKEVDNTRVDTSRFLRFNKITNTGTPAFDPPKQEEVAEKQKEAEYDANVKEREVQVQQKQQALDNAVQQIEQTEQSSIRQSEPVESLYKQVDLKPLDFSRVTGIKTLFDDPEVQFQQGGEVPKYQDGTIKVSSEDDPRYQAYQDSLIANSLAQKYNKSISRAKQEAMDSGATDFVDPYYTTGLLSDYGYSSAEEAIAAENKYTDSKQEAYRRFNEDINRNTKTDFYDSDYSFIKTNGELVFHNPPSRKPGTMRFSNRGRRRDESLYFPPPNQRVIVEENKPTPPKEPNNYTAKVGKRWYIPDSKAHKKALEEERTKTTTKVENKKIELKKIIPKVKQNVKKKAPKKIVLKKDKYGDDKTVKYWDVEIQTNQNFGGGTTKKRVHSRKELDRILKKQKADEKTKTGKNNKVVIKKVKKEYLKKGGQKMNEYKEGTGAYTTGLAYYDPKMEKLANSEIERGEYKKDAEEQFQQGGEKQNTVKYGTPEYRKAYNEGTFLNIPNQLGEVNLTVDKQTGKEIHEDYPYYDELTEKEREYFRDYSSPVGTAVRRKAQTRRGMAEDALDIFPNMIEAVGVGMQIPQSALVEGVEAIRGEDYDFRNIYSTEGKQRVPSDAWGFKTTDDMSWYNPRNVSNFAMDVLVDPENIVGAGIVKNTLENVGKKGVKKSLSSNLMSGMGKNVANLGKNVYKLNPKAVKNWKNKGEKPHWLKGYVEGYNPTTNSEGVELVDFIAKKTRAPYSGNTKLSELKGAYLRKEITAKQLDNALGIRDSPIESFTDKVGSGSFGGVYKLKNNDQLIKSSTFPDPYINSYEELVSKSKPLIESMGDRVALVTKSLGEEGRRVSFMKDLRPSGKTVDLRTALVSRDVPREAVDLLKKDIAKLEKNGLYVDLSNPQNIIYDVDKKHFKIFDVSDSGHLINTSKDKKLINSLLPDNLKQ